MNANEQTDRTEREAELRRQNLQVLYQFHVQTCHECRAAGSLCDVGWILSRQLISS